MTTNEMPYEEYKGFYLGRGITMPAQGVHEWNVYASPGDVAVEKALHEFSSKEEAMKWIDEHAGGYGKPKTEEERRETHYGRYGAGDLPERGTGLGIAPSYYWSVRVDDTNEVAEKSQVYSSVARAVGGAKAYARSQLRDGYWPIESSYTIRVYDAPPPPLGAEPFRKEGVVQEHRVAYGTELI